MRRRPIVPGSICMLVGNHPLAGVSCRVLGYVNDGKRTLAGGITQFYEVEPNAPLPPGVKLGALPFHLFLLAPSLLARYQVRDVEA